MHCTPGNVEPDDVGVDAAASILEGDISLSSAGNEYMDDDIVVNSPLLRGDGDDYGGSSLGLFLCCGTVGSLMPPARRMHQAPGRLHHVVALR